MHFVYIFISFSPVNILSYLRIIVDETELPYGIVLKIKMPAYVPVSHIFYYYCCGITFIGTKKLGYPEKLVQKNLLLLLWHYIIYYYCCGITLIAPFLGMMKNGKKELSFCYEGFGAAKDSANMVSKTSNEEGNVLMLSFHISKLIFKFKSENKKIIKFKTYNSILGCICIIILNKCIHYLKFTYNQYCVK